MIQEKIKSSIADAQRAIGQLLEEDKKEFIEKAAFLIADCLSKGGKLLIAGNGGSLCDAVHFAEELTGYFRSKRRALPAIALSEPGHITCVGNDLGFDQIFARSVEALGRPGDLFIGLTTSGHSPNIINGFKKAKEFGLMTIAFLGKDGGLLKGFADLELIIAGFVTSDRIQEAHMAAIHILIEMVEELLFNSSLVDGQTLQTALQEALGG